MAKSVVKRSPQFELLRIMAMCGVVTNHVFNYGLHIYDNFTLDVSTPGGFILWSILELMNLLALPSVNCYILISGYFLIDKTQFRWRGIWRIWSETWFYTVAIYLLAVVLCVIPFSWHDLLENATPIISNTYWFVTSYLALILIAPLLAWFMKNVSKKQYQVILFLGGIVCFQPFLGQFLMDSQQILLFVYLFLIGGYIRRYHNDHDGKSQYRVWAFCGMLALMYAYTLYKNIYTNNAQYEVYAMAYHGLVLPLSVALFLWVKTWEIRKNPVRRTISFLAPLSFAVYIIHTQPVVDMFLWSHVSRLASSVSPHFLPLFVIAVTLVVYIVCTGIDFLRSAMVKKVKEFSHL